MKIPYNLEKPKSYKDAVAIQNRLRDSVVIRTLPKKIRLVAGVDASYDRGGDLMHAGIVVMTFPRLEVVERAWVSVRETFPYIPGLLSFREIPALLRAFELIENVPDVVVADGQGIAHMRGIGIASHLGVCLGLPTVGAAKSRLVGEHREVAPLLRARRRKLIYEGKTVGTVLCTRDGVKPLYVSPGHLCDIPSAARFVLQCCRGYRVAEPVRAAHALVNEVRRGEIK